jgi:hypothetical protein
MNHDIESKIRDLISETEGPSESYRRELWSKMEEQTEKKREVHFAWNFRPVLYTATLVLSCVLILFIYWPRLDVRETQENVSIDSAPLPLISEEADVMTEEFRSMDSAVPLMNEMQTMPYDSNKTGGGFTGTIVGYDPDAPFIERIAYRVGLGLNRVFFWHW